ncbi:MAG: hypothetical protein JKY96_02835 [Phycisphaerales bacterium]|nr:hypothetical protein [Phycisphaerales bacterium]
MNIGNVGFVSSSSDTGTPESGCPFALGIAAGLRSSMQAVLDGLPGCSSRPTEIARVIGVSRVMVSRTASSIKKENPIETLTSIPGPESLRSIVNGARQAGVSKEISDRALRAIDEFDGLIRERFGTRSALNAALSTQNTESLDRFEQASRYQVFKGMGQVLGVQANTWITSMMLIPNPSNPDLLDVTTLHGTVGLRRLRSDTPIHFSHGTPPKIATNREAPERIEIDLSSFYEHNPAPLESKIVNGQLIHTFSATDTGKDAKYDMLAVVHAPGTSSRYASENRSKRGISVIPDVPVVTLVADILLHGDLFDGIDPQLSIYNMMARGGASPDDRSRDIDLVASSSSDSIRQLGSGLDALALPEIPSYQGMLQRVVDEFGYNTEDFRAYRLRIAYPVIGFQFVIAFEAPPKPSA